MNLRSLNKEIQKIDANLTIYKGEGYFYIEYDCEFPVSRQIFETHSVYVCSLNQLTVEQWIEEAKTLCNRVAAIYA